MMCCVVLCCLLVHSIIRLPAWKPKFLFSERYIYTIYIWIVYSLLSLSTYQLFCLFTPWKIIGNSIAFSSCIILHPFRLLSVWECVEYLCIVSIWLYREKRKQFMPEDNTEAWTANIISISYSPAIIRQC